MRRYAWLGAAATVALALAILGPRFGVGAGDSASDDEILVYKTPT